LKFLIGLILSFFCCSIFAETQIANLYIWANYIPQSVIQQFEHETGINVHVSNFDSNETMFSKLKADPHIGYDVVVPSSYYVDRMRQQGMLQTLNKTQIPNFKYSKPDLLNKPYDPGNLYSIPYVWGTTGILVNKHYWDPKTIQNWSDLWQPRFKNQLLMLDDPREVFAIALIKLGYSINTQNIAQIQQAYEILKSLMNNVKVFNSDAFTNIYIDEDATVGMSWSGEAFLASQENPNLEYVYPKDGFSIWIDCLAIPKYAPHVENAEKLINFILRPDIAAKIIAGQGYAVANSAAIGLLPPALQKNPILNPSADIIKRGETQLDVGNKVTVYQNFWQILKLS
jgi:spermidine/putrescine transport system substrate-binding protein